MGFQRTTSYAFKLLEHVWEEFATSSSDLVRKALQKAWFGRAQVCQICWVKLLVEENFSCRHAFTIIDRSSPASPLKSWGQKKFTEGVWIPDSIRNWKVTATIRKVEHGYIAWTHRIKMCKDVQVQRTLLWRDRNPTGPAAPYKKSTKASFSRLELHILPSEA